MPLITETIRVVAADDHPMIRKGFQHLFSQQNELQLAALATNGKELIAAVEEHQPHIVIVDIKMPQMDGREAVRLLQLQFPQIGIIAYSMHEEEALLVDMRKAGVRGYLVKGADGEEICRAVRAVHAGGEYYCQAIRQRMDHLFQYGKLGAAKSDLKQDYVASELQIIQLICQEHSCKEIADALNMNKRTVEHYKERIQEKMGVKGAVGIAVYAVKNWLLY